MLFAEAIRVALEDLGEEVLGVVTTGEEAVASVRRTRPDIVLMDIALPDQSGLAVGRAILGEWPDMKIIALTALSDRTAVEEALRIGFRGYITKDTPVAQFVNSLQSVLDGHIVLPHRLGPTGKRSAAEDEVALLADQLTAREREVLGLLVEGADGLTVAMKLGISRNTVRTHVQNILMKLQVHSRLEAATFAVRHRLVQAPTPLGGTASSRSSSRF
jgi:two-component system, NarL family, nitrate/nitrite response regulator NarL